MELLIDFIQNMDGASLALFSGIIAVAIICGVLMATKFGSSGNIPVIDGSKSRRKANVLNTPQNDSQRGLGSASITQNPFRNGSKQKYNKPQKRDSFATYSYQRNLIDLSPKDNQKPQNVVKQKNNYSGANYSNNMGIYSSNNGNLPHTSPEYPNKKYEEMFSRNSNKSRRNNYSKCKSNVNGATTTAEKEIKENIKPIGTSYPASKKDLCLRKQCTKAAAINTSLKNSQMKKQYNHMSLESHMYTKCSLSSSSSSITSNISSLPSSATNSPAQSANSSPTASPTTNKRLADNLKRRSPPLRLFTKLNMNEQELTQQMKRYVIDPSLLTMYGFPVESIHNNGCVDIYKCMPKHLAEEAITKDNKRHHINFYGQRKSDVINESDGLNPNYNVPSSNASSLADSGLVSGESSPRFTDSDSSETGEEESNSPLMAFCTPDGVQQIFLDYCNTREKQCVRCFKIFEVNEKGEYSSLNSCYYHWGKLSNVYNGKCFINSYSCCQGEEHSEGCSKHYAHVWNGTVFGLNGPFTDFVHTRKSNRNRVKQQKVYALDCEMSYTGLGLDVTKVTVIGFDGSMVYEHFVKPQAQIIDYNTRFSGVSAKDFLPGSNTSTKTFNEVQKDLINLFDSDTILVGHALENDLKALRIVHKTIIDTSILFSHSTGYPYKRSLKNLTKSYLKRDIQCGENGHCSFEDSRACLELIMWKIRNDLRHSDINN